VHIHFVVQPAWNEWRGAFGRPDPFVQAVMFQAGNAPPVQEVEKICVQVKKLLQ
jgi:hypothetical protein